jgi:uncharacterized protein
MAFLPAADCARPGAKRFADPPIGLLAGIMGGMSGMFGPPLSAYMVGSVCTRTSSLSIRRSYFSWPAPRCCWRLAAWGRCRGPMSWADVAVSAGALVPIYIGMPIGRWLRRHCPPSLFRAVVLAVLAIGGLQMIRAALS